MISKSLGSINRKLQLLSEELEAGTVTAQCAVTTLNAVCSDLEIEIDRATRLDNATINAAPEQGQKATQGA